MELAAFSITLEYGFCGIDPDIDFSLPVQFASVGAGAQLATHNCSASIYSTAA